MRYFYPVPDIYEIDPISLAQTIHGSEIGECSVHLGNGVVVIEAPSVLSEGKKTVLDTIIQSHSPVRYEWISVDGRASKCKVRTTQDVDRATAQRIRETIGGEGDPIQEQLKIMRKFLWALDVMVNKKDYSAEQITEANQIRTCFLDSHNKIELLIQDGKKLKKDKGF